MNIQQSAGVAQLSITQKPNVMPMRKMSAEAVANRVFQLAAQSGHPFMNITPKAWARKWLASEEFVLTEVETGRVAIPIFARRKDVVRAYMNASADSREPIVADINKNHVGGCAATGFIPEIIVVDGKHRHQAATLKAEVKIKAWVGVKALPKIESMRAQALQPSSRMRTKLESAAILANANNRPMHPSDCNCSACSSKKMSAGGPGSGRHAMHQALLDKGYTHVKSEQVPGSKSMEHEYSHPSDKKMVVHSLNDRVTSWNTKKVEGFGKTELQDHLNDLKAASDPSDVTPHHDPSDRYDKPLGRSLDPSDTGSDPLDDTGKSISPGSGNGPRTPVSKGASHSELQNMQFVRAKDVKAGPIKLKRLIVKYKKDVKAGWVPPMEGKAAPGFEGTVKHMKKHSEISNPYALSWWMKDKGYQSHK